MKATLERALTQPDHTLPLLPSTPGPTRLSSMSFLC